MKYASDVDLLLLHCQFEIILKSVLGIFSGNFLDLKELSAQDGHLGNFITLPMPPQMPCRFWHKLELLITGID